MAYNKVVYDGRTLVDLTADTVDASVLLAGYTAHGKDGSAIVGTFDPLNMFYPVGSYYETSDADFDPNIGEKLAKPENLQRFAVLGLIALHDILAENRDRLTVIEDMAEELDEIRRENDIVKRWMWECGISEPRHVVGKWVDDLYRDFTQWCDESGERYAVSRGVFSKKIIAAIGRIKTRETRDRTLGRRGRVYEIV